MMTERRRHMMLIIAESNQAVLPILHMIDDYVRCDDILDWIIRNRLTGEEVVSMIKFQFKMSPLTFIKWVLSKIDKERELRPILMGRDMKPRP